MTLAHDRRPAFVRGTDTGVTPLRALGAEPRVSYRLCVPRGYDPKGDSRHPLVVAVHGTAREDHASLLQPLCEEAGAIVLAPMFPSALAIPDDHDAYKFLRFHDLACDLLVLAMVEEVARRYRLAGGGARFALCGFSGGAQFAHRFAYLHAGRLSALAIGAPGLVTLADPALPWWVGAGGMEAAFGLPLALGALRGVPTLVLVGAEDTDGAEIAIREGAHDWMPGVNDAGPTRLHRAAALTESLRAAGVPVRHEVAPGVGHDPAAVMAAMLPFLRDAAARA